MTDRQHNFARLWTNRFQRYGSVIVMAGLSAFAFPPRCSLAEELASLDSIAAGLEQSAKEIDPIELEWTTVRSSELGKSDFQSLLGYSDYALVEFFTDTRVTFRWQEEMIYQCIRGETAIIPDRPAVEPVKKIPFGREYAFNHTYLYIGDAEPETSAAGLIPALVIDPTDNPVEARSDKRIFRVDYLSAIGFWIPERVRDLGKPASPELNRLLREGAVLESISKVTVDGIECERVEIKLSGVRSIFILDPTRAYAMLRREDIDSQNRMPIRTVVSSKFEQAAGRSLWLPERVSITHFVRKGNRAKGNVPIYSETYSLKKVNREVMPADAFILSYKMPGTIVIDYTLPETRQTRKGYVIPADADDLDRVLGARPRIWLVVLNVAVVIVLSFLVLRKFVGSR